MLIYINALPQK